MLERGSYIPWASRFKRFLNRKRENQKWLLKALEDGPYVFRNITPTGSIIPRLQEVEDLQGDDLLYYDAEMELMNMILLSIPNEIYNSVDSWQEVRKVYDPLAQVAHSVHLPVITSSIMWTQPSYVGDSVNIQSREIIGNVEEYRRAYVQGEVVEGMNVTNETANVQRIVRIFDFHATLFNGSMLNCDVVAKQDESGVNLTDEQNVFLFAELQGWIEIEEVSATMLNASISTRNVNSGSVEKDTHVYDLCALETLARNAYDEAAKQQRFAQKVQQQNMTLTSQIEMYKERNRIKLNHFLMNYWITLMAFRHIKEMKDAFEQNDVYLDEIERQNDLLKDQLLEVSLKHDIELCVLLNHECVDKSLHDELEQVKKKSLEIQEGLKA
ncbi:hypothetical protein Tco_0662465 [Tanacetum coccineum]